MQQQLSPIALFAFARPEHVLRCLESLAENRQAERSVLFVFCDGPKPGASASMLQRIADVRHIARSKQWCAQVNVIEADSNKGLAASIIEGVTRLVNQYGRLIVLEDDLVLEPGFLEFMNMALERYAEERQIMQVSGYMFPCAIKEDTDAVFLPLTTSWGWATWARAWNFFDNGALGAEQLKQDPALRDKFNLDGAYDYANMLFSQCAGRIDSWAIRWYWSVFKAEGLVLFPVRSLLRNDGFDGSGTHGKPPESLARSTLAGDFSVRTLPNAIAVADSWPAIKRHLATGSGSRSIFGLLKERLNGLVACFKKRS